MKKFNLMIVSFILFLSTIGYLFLNVEVKYVLITYGTIFGILTLYFADIVDISTPKLISLESVYKNTEKGLLRMTPWMYDGQVYYTVSCKHPVHGVLDEENTLILIKDVYGFKLEVSSLDASVKPGAHIVFYVQS